MDRVIRSEAWTALLFAMVALTACGAPDVIQDKSPAEILAPPFYSSEPVTGTVIDGDTAQPVAGAIVAGIWRKVSALSGAWEGIWIASETSTDERGRFTISRWGPRSSPTGGFLDRRHPEIWVIKQGYLVEFFDNDGAKTCLLVDDPNTPQTWLTLPPNKMTNASIRTHARTAEGGSIWNGKALPIRRAANDEQLARSLAGANPRDPHAPKIATPLPLYFAEWHSSRTALARPAQARVPDPPLALTDYDVISVESRP